MEVKLWETKASKACWTEYSEFMERSLFDSVSSDKGISVQSRPEMEEEWWWDAPSIEPDAEGGWWEEALEEIEAFLDKLKLWISSWSLFGRGGGDDKSSTIEGFLLEWWWRWWWLWPVGVCPPVWLSVWCDGRPELPGACPGVSGDILILTPVDNGDIGGCLWKGGLDISIDWRKEEKEWQLCKFVFLEW